jgi:hypothetical protein
MQANILHLSAFSDLFNVLPLNRYCIIHVLSQKVTESHVTFDVSFEAHCPLRVLLAELICGQNR